MVRHKFEIFVSSLVFITFLIQNVSPFQEENCPDSISISSSSNSSKNGEVYQLHALSRVKRGFGGQEPINFTLINANVLGPNGWIPLFCGATLDMVFHVTGYIVLGKPN